MREVALEHLRQQPHLRQVGDLVQHLPGHEALALNRGFLQYHPVRGRAQRQVLDGLAILRQALQFGFRNIPVAQALQGAVHQSLHALLHLRAAARERLHASLRDQIFLLRRDQVGTVDVHQWLTRSHRLAGGIDVELLDPAVELRGNGVQQALVRLHRRHRPYRAPEIAQGDRFGFHAELLHLVQTELDQRSAGGRSFTFVRIDRDIVHAHLVLFRHRRSVRQAHRVAVIQNLRFCGGRRRRRWCGRLDRIGRVAGGGRSRARGGLVRCGPVLGWCRSVRAPPIAACERCKDQNQSR